MHPTDADDLEFDEDNEAHLARHGVRPIEVFEVFDSDPVYVPNKKGRSAHWKMLGDTDGGRALTILVVCQEVRRLLRPITGWDSQSWELTRWRPRRGR